MGSSLSSQSGRLSSSRPDIAEAYRLTASEAMAKIRRGDMTVEEYAQSLLLRIRKRDDVVKAWAYLDPDYVIKQARALDKIPEDKRGPLHGVVIAVKDVIYTKDMPTQHNSPIYRDDHPAIDSNAVAVLREAGALLLGKTTTTEFAATLTGPATTNPHDSSRTPGGSSSGSGAAVGDLQAPVALGTQTGGSTIRPASFNGVYALKPTWNSISREGLKIYALIFDTLGMYARSIDDLVLLADVFDLQDDDESDFAGLRGAKFAVCQTMAWEFAGPGTREALDKAVTLLRGAGATVEELRLPSEFDDLPELHETALFAEGRVNFLAAHRVGKEKLSPFLADHVVNSHGISRKQQLQAFDAMAALRPKIDDIAGQYAAILAPSVPDEAPEGIQSTGNAIFCAIWSALHTPVVNIPGFQGANGMPIGLSLIAPRYRDRHLLKVSKAVGELFEAEGGWKRVPK
ncbi:amidase signature domain-containing protein [Stachybotrys elegans]|uniref:Amidase signature domain-containing protein n=1 Tax=Stachybotrys elegans TaxID=80388 RepID=A0A8K0SY33_9HYPO|nr:amidase signature domain-containing protein [Stachybotrys elegans]